VWQPRGRRHAWARRAGRAAPAGGQRLRGRGARVAWHEATCRPRSEPRRVVDAVEAALGPVRALVNSPRAQPARRSSTRQRRTRPPRRGQRARDEAASAASCQRLAEGTPGRRRQPEHATRCTARSRTARARPPLDRITIARARELGPARNLGDALNPGARSGTAG